MNSLSGPIKSRAEAFINSLPMPDKERGKAALNLFIEKVVSRKGLLPEDLTSNFRPNISSEAKRAIQTLVDAVNGALLSANTSDVEVVQTVADIVYQIYRDMPFKESNAPVAFMLGNCLLCRANRPFMLVTKSDEREIQKASRTQNGLRLWFAERYRDAILFHGAIYQKDIGANNQNTTYHNGSGKKVVVQWNDLVREEQKWLGLG